MSPSPPAPEPEHKKVRRAWAETHPGGVGIIVLACFVVVCAGIKLAAPIVVPMLLGAFVATANIPLVLYLYRRRVPLVMTVVLALAADALALGAFSSLLVGSAAELTRRLPSYLAALGNTEAEVSRVLRGFGLEQRLIDVFDPRAALELIASVLGDLATALWNIVLALIIAAFLLLRFVNLGGGRRSNAAGGKRIRRAVREMYRYIAIKTATSMLTGLCIGALLFAADAELPILFGLLAFLLNYIPTLGSFVAAVPAILVALLQQGVPHASIVVLIYMIINIAIGNVIEPRVMGRVLGLWPSVVLLSVLFWGWLLGIVGAVLSALLTLGVKLILLSTHDLRSVGLALGPVPGSARAGREPEDLLEEAMPQTMRDPK